MGGKCREVVSLNDWTGYGLHVAEHFCISHNLSGIKIPISHICGKYCTES